MKLITPLEDRRIPANFVVREHKLELLAPEIQALKCRWLARHEGDHPACDWFSWEKSYPAAVLAARVHGATCASVTQRKRTRTR